MTLFLSLIISLLVAIWGVFLLDAPARAAHPWWIARHEMLYLTGLLSVGLMSVAMFLSTRPIWLETPLGGMDRIYRTHKWAGILAGVFAVSHWLVEMSDEILKKTIGRSGRLPKEKLGELADAIRHFAKDSGEWSFYILILMIAITLWQIIPYRSWRRLHRVMPLVYLALLFHAIMLAPPHVWTNPAGIPLIILMLAGVYGAIRALTGTIGNRFKTTGKVISIHRLSPQVIRVRCQLNAGWRAYQPGQFAWVRFDADEPPHPFTIASADHGDACVEFCIKALGDYTEHLTRSLLEGQAMEIEGPYGRFDLGRRKRNARQIWIAGGIGVTPFLAWLDSFQGGKEPCEAELHYCTKNTGDDPFVTRLETLCARFPGIRLHIHDSARGERLNADMLSKSEQKNATEVWFCGPVSLGDQLHDGLKRLTNCKLRFHQEAFSLR